MNTATMTPREIDTVLADLWAKEAMLSLRLSSQIEARDREATKTAATSWAYVERLEKEIAELTSKVEALRAQAEPYETEYRSRPWKRYFLVPDGHVHRGRNCTTCFPTTKYGWLPALSGCDEKVMVAEYGELACTVCFPDAPSMYAMMGGKSAIAKRADEAKAAREAKRAEAARVKAEKAIANPDGTPLKGMTWRIETLSAAKREVVDLAGSLMNVREGSWNAAHRTEMEAAYARVAAAIAHKTGTDVQAVKAEAVNKAMKRGY